MYYKVDDYVHEEYSDDTINLKCVLSWKSDRKAQGRSARCQINFHNCFYFDSEKSQVKPDRAEAVRAELLRIAGRSDVQRALGAPLSGNEFVELSVGPA